MSTTYITEEELRVAPYEIDEDEADPKFIEVLQGITKALIDKLCLQDFDQEGTDSEPVEKKMSGDGKDTLFLPKRLVTLKKVRLYSSLTDYDEYDADQFFVRPKFISWLTLSDTASARTILLTDGLFPKGVGNIGVRGVWGFASVPDPIKYLQGRLIQKAVEDEEFASFISSEGIGDYTYTTKAEEGSITGEKELDLIIKSHRGWRNYAH